MQIEQIEVLEFIVEGVPALDHPSIGDEMSNGAIITESNQKDYYTPFSRTEGECLLVGSSDEIIGLYTNKDGVTVLTIASTLQQPFNDLTGLTIYDHLTNEIYDAHVVGHCRL